MKIKVTEATPIQIDYLVARCEGKKGVLHDDGITRCIVVAAPSGVYKGTWKPSINWAQGGPIIYREKIGFSYYDEGDGWEVPGWGAWRTDVDDRQTIAGPTPLIATMRCYVASKLGDEVDVPEELV